MWYPATFLLLVQSVSGSVVLTQTHPAAPYVCRTGNITLRCQYDGVENVIHVQWIIDGMLVNDLSTIMGHTESLSASSYQEAAVDSYMNLMGNYSCAVIVQVGPISRSNNYTPNVESADVTISSLTLTSRTATTLSVTWSAGYPKCYSFTVSHSTQDGSINVTQPADNDTSYTLTSLQPGTTYRIEVEAVRKGDGADGQRAKIVGDFTTEGAESNGPRMSSATHTTIKPSSLVEMYSATHTSSTPTAAPLGPIIGGISGGLLALAISSALLVIAVICSVQLCRRKVVPGACDPVSEVPKANGQEGETQGCDNTKQTYAVLDWQNPEQRPVKPPDNDWFTVQYSEVQFVGNK